MIHSVPGRALITGGAGFLGPHLIERLLDDSLAIPIPGIPPLHVSFSAGIACFPVDGETCADLLKAADRRVYHAKDSGRGRVEAGQTGPSGG